MIQQSNLFLFGLGLFNIYSWNTILNLNGFFQEYFNDPNISQKYTITFFILMPLSLFFSNKLGHIYKTEIILKYVFIIVMFVFNLIYIYTVILTSNGNLINLIVFLFLVGCVSICVTVYSVFLKEPFFSFGYEISN